MIRERRDWSSGVLALALLASARVALPVCAEPLPGGPKFLVLSQIRIGSDHYFVPTGAWALLISPSGSGNRSNVIAYAEEDRRFGYSKALVDSWMDLEGHAHSSAILERQTDYLGFRQAFQSDKSRWSGDPAFPDLPPVLPSGAMDLQTLLIPLHRQQARLFGAEIRMRLGCRGKARENAQRWAEAVSDARREFDSFQRLAEGLPRRQGRRIADNWADYHPPDQLWGLENVKIPALKWDERRAPSSPYGRPPFPLNIDFRTPWLEFVMVPETVDLAALGPADAQNLARGEAAAAAAVSRAAAICPEEGETR